MIGGHMILWPRQPSSWKARTPDPIRRLDKSSPSHAWLCEATVTAWQTVWGEVRGVRIHQPQDVTDSQTCQDTNRNHCDSGRLLCHIKILFISIQDSSRIATLEHIYVTVFDPSCLETCAHVSWFWIWKVVLHAWNSNCSSPISMVVWTCFAI